MMDDDPTDARHGDEPGPATEGDRRRVADPRASPGRPGLVGASEPRIVTRVTAETRRCQLARARGRDQGRMGLRRAVDIKV